MEPGVPFPLGPPQYDFVLGGPGGWALRSNFYLFNFFFLIQGGLIIASVGYDCLGSRPFLVQVFSDLGVRLCAIVHRDDRRSEKNCSPEGPEVEGGGGPTNS